MYVRMYFVLKRCVLCEPPVRVYVSWTYLHASFRIPALGVVHNYRHL